MPDFIPVTTTGGYGTVVLGASGLPPDLTLTDNGDGTGEITGTLRVGVTGASKTHTTSGAFSTPDTAVNSVTGDIDIRADVFDADYGATRMFLDKGPAADRSYNFGVFSGTIFAEFQVGGSFVFAQSSAHGLTNSTRYQLRVTRVAASGLYTFYTRDASLDLPLRDNSSWVELSSASDTAGSLVDNALALWVGARHGGVSDHTDRVYEALVLDGIEGSVAAHFDPAQDYSGPYSPTDATAFTDSVVGATWTPDAGEELIKEGEVTTVTGASVNSPHTVTITATDDLGRTSRRVFEFTVNTLTVDAIADTSVEEDGAQPTFAPALSVDNLGVQVVSYGESTPLAGLTFNSRTATGQSGFYLPMKYLGGDVLAIGAESNDTVKTYDVSNPASVTQLGSIGGQKYPEDLDYWSKAGVDYLLVANAGLDDATLIDVTNRSSLTSVSTFSNQNSGACFISDTYLATYRQNADSFEVWDWSTPATPTQVGTLSYSASDGNLQRINANYVAIGGAIVDVSTPSAPTLAASGLAVDFVTVVRADLVLLGNTLYDVTTPSSPVTKGTITGTSGHCRLDDNHVITHDESSKTVRFWDVSNPDTPVEIANEVISAGVRTEWVESDGNRVWVMDDAGGLNLLDTTLAGVVETQPTFAPALSINDLTAISVFGEGETAQPQFLPPPAEDAFSAVAHTVYDMAEETTPDGNPISTLTDQTGNGRDATQATSANQPTAQTVSGMKVARFDGTNDDMDSPTFTSVNGNNTTFICLQKFDSGVSTSVPWATAGAGNNPYGGYASNGAWRTYNGNSSVGGASVDTAFHVVVTIFRNGNTQTYIDGGAADLTLTGTVTSFDRLVLGSEDGFGFHNGDIAYLGFYDGDLKADDSTLLNDVCQALADRAGITWTNIT